MAEQPRTTSSNAQLCSSSAKSPDVSLQKPQAPILSGFPSLPNGDFQFFPIMYPALINSHQNQENMNRRAGLYAVPVYPFSGPVAGIPSNTLIPLTYNVPTASTEERAMGDELGQEGQQQQHERQNQQPAPQRQVVVRRFPIAFQIDLLLILKLAAVIFLFNQDGSRQRLVFLVIFAALIYLYQTGALTPLIRWLSQGMQRAAVPPHPPRAAAARADNDPPPARHRIENAALAEGLLGGQNENQAAGDNVDQVVENENLAEPDGANVGHQWWGIVKEIQMIVFGFITSLLPGFHNID